MPYPTNKASDGMPRSLIDCNELGQGESLSTCYLFFILGLKFTPKRLLQRISYWISYLGKLHFSRWRELMSYIRPTPHQNIPPSSSRARHWWNVVALTSLCFALRCFVTLRDASVYLYNLLRDCVSEHQKGTRTHFSNAHRVAFRWKTFRRNLFGVLVFRRCFFF